MLILEIECVLHSYSKYSSITEKCNLVYTRAEIGWFHFLVPGYQLTHKHRPPSLHVQQLIIIIWTTHGALLCACTGHISART